jgi:hypothetical protein
MSCETDTSYLGLLRIAGVDAKRFLQGQLTCNVDEVTTTEYRLGAHCNPAGRIISLFRLFLYHDDYYMQMPRETVPVALTALKKYAVFFKVALSDVSDALIFIGYCKNPLTLKQEDIHAGIVAIYPETSAKFLPHEINLPELNGVSFNKGCYTGQEIIARMHYRGKSKYHLYHAATATDHILHRGQNIYGKIGAAGYLVDYCQTGYNSYELLITAHETDQLYLDPELKITLQLR